MTRFPWTIQVVKDYIYNGVDHIEGMDEDELFEFVENMSAEDKKEILRYLSNGQTDQIYDVAASYSEPGYCDPENGYIFLGDWWIEKVRGHRESYLVKLIQAAGGACEWHDEWVCCPQCSGAVRTKPDSYSWTPGFIEFADEIYCSECLDTDSDLRRDYLASLEGNPRAALTVLLDLEAHGYVQIEQEFESGFYGGQCDDPEKIALGMGMLGLSRYLFVLDRVGQFDIRFSVWIHKDEKEAWETRGQDIDSAGVDPARMLKNALDDAATQMKTMDSGIILASCNTSTGTATVRTVTPEDWEGDRLDDILTQAYEPPR